MSGLRGHRFFRRYGFSLDRRRGIRVLTLVELLEGVEEEEIRKGNGSIVIVPTFQSDPILELRKHFVVCGAPDASAHQDLYLYGSAPCQTE